MGVLATLILAIVAIVTAIRLQQIGTQPVAPNVPKSKPKAQAVNQCQKSWTIVDGPPATPTVTGILSPTPTPGIGAICILENGYRGKLMHSDDPQNTPGNYLINSANWIKNGSTLTPGQIIVFEVPIKNTGATALNSRYTDSLSSLVDFMDAESGCTFQQSNRTVTCQVGSIQPGVMVSKSFRVRIKADAGGILDNTAIVYGGADIDDTCRSSGYVVPGATNTPTPRLTNTPAPLAVICTDLDVPSGTSRKQSENISFVCKGSPPSQITQCRFRFGDGTPEVFEDDCNVIKFYPSTGQYATSCEVRDADGYWRASSACEETIEIVSGPTNTPAPGATAYPTNQQSAPKPSAAPRARTTAIPTVPEQNLPNAGGIGQTVGVVIGGIGILLLGLLMLL